METIRVTCVECNELIDSNARLANQQKVCVPSGAAHRQWHVERDIPMGSEKCCRCVKSRRWARRSVAPDDYMTPQAGKRLLAAARAYLGREYSVCFMTAINAMLRVSELPGIMPEHLTVGTEPCVLGIPIMPRCYRRADPGEQHELAPVRLDCRTARALESWIADNGIRDGCQVFPHTKRHLQLKFKEARDAAGLGEAYTINCLRETGLKARAEKVLDTDDLEILRQDARHSSILTTQRYVPKSKRGLKAFFNRIPWLWVR